MTLEYVKVLETNENPYILRALPLTQENLAKLLGENPLSALHRGLFRQAMRVNRDADLGYVQHPEGEFILSTAGFVYSPHDIESSTVSHPSSLLSAATGDAALAVNLLQHLILVFGLAVPPYVTVQHNKIGVKAAYINDLMETTNIVSQRLTTGKGYRFSCVMPDGFELAVYTSSTVIAANNDAAIAHEFGQSRLSSLANDKLWELVGWQFRQWAAEQIELPLRLMPAVSQLWQEPETSGIGVPVVTNALG